MAVTLDATVGGSVSNSYVTLLRANTLMEQLPHADEWFEDLAINKTQLLVHASRLIDRGLVFQGEKVSSSQALEWPRTGVTHPLTGAAISPTSIPEFVEWATVEWAFDLYLTPDPDRGMNAAFDILRTPSYHAEFRGSARKVLPQAVAELLLPYGSRTSSSMVRLIRA